MDVLVSLLPGGGMVGVDCVVGYWLDYLDKYKAYYSRTQSLLATIVHSGGHLCGLSLTVLPSCHIIHQSPGPGTWQCDFLDLICDCFPISAI